MGYREDGGGRLPDRVDLERTLRRAAAGDQDALARLYALYADELYEAIYRLTQSSADARDVIQEVFIGLPEALPGFEGRGRFYGWLRRVAVRATLMKLRGRRRRREVSLGRLRTPIPLRNEDDTVLDRLELERALAELPLELRAVFVLKEVEGFTHQEIGSLLGISEGASAVRLYRARERLRRRLG